MNLNLLATSNEVPVLSEKCEVGKSKAIAKEVGSAFEITTG